MGPLRLWMMAGIAMTAASCLGTGPDLPAPQDVVGEAAALALLQEVLVNGHDHTDPAEHALASWRLEQRADFNLPTDGVALSPPSEFILHDHYAFVSLFHPSAGMVILDLEDPVAPRQIGRFDSGTAYVNDVEVSPDGKWAFLPTSPIETRENDPIDGGTLAIGDYGIQVVDVSDPTKPELAAVWVSPDADPRRLDPASLPGLAGDPEHAAPSLLQRARSAVGMGYHRCDLEVIGGSLYVFGASLGFARVDILRFDVSPVPQLTFVASYISDDARNPMLDTSSSPNGFGVHDVTVDPDPIDGFPLMAVSHWRSGAHFVDVSDPANPRFLGRWNDFPVEQGNVHNVEFTQIEGRRFAVAVPEYPVDAEDQGGIWIVDLADFSNPKLHGSWNLPGPHPTEADPPAAGNHVFSTNRVLLRNGTIFDAHFHAGVIVLDASTLEKAAQPALLGFVVPGGESRVPYSGIQANPYIYDAIPRGEYLYYTDLTGGFHVAWMPPEVVQGHAW